jgi:hypothetical protein
MQQQRTTVSEMLIFDMVYACVQTFHQFYVIVTVHCDAFRYKLAVDNSGSTDKNDEHCLDV